MTTATIHITPRARRDLVTNPAYDELLGELEKSIQAETNRLALDSASPDVTKVNWQGGALEGAKRAANILKKYRAAALEGFEVSEKTP